jgi:hypothetical protein
MKQKLKSDIGKPDGVGRATITCGINTKRISKKERDRSTWKIYIWLCG